MSVRMSYTYRVSEDGKIERFDYRLAGKSRDEWMAYPHEDLIKSIIELQTASIFSTDQINRLSRKYRMTDSDSRKILGELDEIDLWNEFRYDVTVVLVTILRSLSAGRESSEKELVEKMKRIINGENLAPVKEGTE